MDYDKYISDLEKALYSGALVVKNGDEEVRFQSAYEIRNLIQDLKNKKELSANPDSANQSNNAIIVQGVFE